MSKRPSLYSTCPITGITYTVTDDYSVTQFRTMRHYNYSQLDTIMKKERWNAPSSYIVGATLRQLYEKDLIANHNSESSRVAGHINYLLSTNYTSSQLYSLYTTVRDSSAGLKSAPIRLSFATIDPSLNAAHYYNLILSIGKQVITYMEKELLFAHKPQSGNPSRTSIPTKNKLDPDTVRNRIAKQITPLMTLVMEQVPNKCPSYYSSTLSRKLAVATNAYSDLAPVKQEQYKQLLSELFTLAITHSIIGVDDILYKSYFIFKNLLEKQLVSTDNNLWAEL